MKPFSRNKFFNTILIVCFLANTLFTPVCGAQVLTQTQPLPELPMLCYLSVNSANPSNYFNFLLDKGSGLPSANLNSEAKKLVNYFFLGLTLSSDSFWVNLNPKEENKMTSDELSKTDMGRVLLELDLKLKKDVAKYLHPANPKGKEFWAQLYKKIGVSNVRHKAITTSNRVWIVPGSATVVETEDGALVTDAKLKVMLESEYLQGTGNRVQGVEKTQLNPEISVMSEQLMKEIILPALTKDVNEGLAYAQLRQIYQSLVLAQYYKGKYKNSDGRYQSLINKNKTQGLESDLPWSKQGIWQDYLQSYQNGEYKVKYFLAGINRMYFTGGMSFDFQPGSIQVIPSSSSVAAEKLSSPILETSSQFPVITNTAGATPFSGVDVLNSGSSPITFIKDDVLKLLEFAWAKSVGWHLHKDEKILANEAQDLLTKTINYVKQNNSLIVNTEKDFYDLVGKVAQIEKTYAPQVIEETVGLLKEVIKEHPDLIPLSEKEEVHEILLKLYPEASPYTAAKKAKEDFNGAALEKGQPILYLRYAKESYREDWKGGDLNEAVDVKVLAQDAQDMRNHKDKIIDFLQSRLEDKNYGYEYVKHLFRELFPYFDDKGLLKIKQPADVELRRILLFYYDLNPVLKTIFDQVVNREEFFNGQVDDFFPKLRLPAIDVFDVGAFIAERDGLQSERGIVLQQALKIFGVGKKIVSSPLEAKVAIPGFAEMEQKIGFDWSEYLSQVEDGGNKKKQEMVIVEDSDSNVKISVVTEYSEELKSNSVTFAVSRRNRGRIHPITGTAGEEWWDIFNVTLFKEAKKCSGERRHEEDGFGKVDYTPKIGKEAIGEGGIGTFKLVFDKTKKRSQVTFSKEVDSKVVDRMGHQDEVGGYTFKFLSVSSPISLTKTQAETWLSNIAEQAENKASELRKTVGYAEVSGISPNGPSLRLITDYSALGKIAIAMAGGVANSDPDITMSKLIEQAGIDSQNVVLMKRLITSELGKVLRSVSSPINLGKTTEEAIELLKKVENALSDKLELNKTALENASINEDLENKGNKDGLQKAIEDIGFLRDKLQSFIEEQKNITNFEEFNQNFESFLSKLKSEKNNPEYYNKMLSDFLAVEIKNKNTSKIQSSPLEIKKTYLSKDKSRRILTFSDDSILDSAYVSSSDMTYHIFYGAGVTVKWNFEEKGNTVSDNADEIVKRHGIGLKVKELQVSLRKLINEKEIEDKKLASAENNLKLVEKQIKDLVEDSKYPKWTQILDDDTSKKDNRTAYDKADEKRQSLKNEIYNTSNYIYSLEQRIADIEVQIGVLISGQATTSSPLVGSKRPRSRQSVKFTRDNILTLLRSALSRSGKVSLAEKIRTPIQAFLKEMIDRVEKTEPFKSFPKDYEIASTREDLYVLLAELVKTKEGYAPKVKSKAINLVMRTAGEHKASSPIDLGKTTDRALSRKQILEAVNKAIRVAKNLGEIKGLLVDLKVNKLKLEEKYTALQVLALLLQNSETGVAAKNILQKVLFPELPILSLNKGQIVVLLTKAIELAVEEIARLKADSDLDIVSSEGWLGANIRLSTANISAKKILELTQAKLKTASWKEAVKDVACELMGEYNSNFRLRNLLEQAAKLVPDAVVVKTSSPIEFSELNKEQLLALFDNAISIGKDRGAIYDEAVDAISRKIIFSISGQGREVSREEDIVKNEEWSKASKLAGKLAATINTLEVVKKEIAKTKDGSHEFIDLRQEFVGFYEMDSDLKQLLDEASGASSPLQLYPEPGTLPVHQSFSGGNPDYGGIDLSNIKVSIGKYRGLPIEEKNKLAGKLKTLYAVDALLEKKWDSLAYLYYQEIMLLIKDNIVSNFDEEDRKNLIMVGDKLMEKGYLGGDAKSLDFLHTLQLNRPFVDLKLVLADREPVGSPS